MHFIRTVIFAFAICAASAFASSLLMPRGVCGNEGDPCVIIENLDPCCKGEGLRCINGLKIGGVSDERPHFDLSHSYVQACEKVTPGDS